MRVLALVPDAFGGHGGIAEYNRDLLRALCAYPTCSEVVAIPRQVPMRDAAKSLPARLTYVTSDLGGKRDYLITVLRVVHSSPRFDLVLCGHINLLPVAFLLRLWTRVPVALLIHGIEAWRPTSRPQTNFLSSRIDASISGKPTNQTTLPRVGRTEGNWRFLLPSSVDFERFRSRLKNTTLLDRHCLTGKIVVMTLGRLSASESYKGRMHAGSTGFHANAQTSGGARIGTR